jgi:gliding motility-associated-like protein
MVSQAEFTFFNNTLNGTRYVWNFGDGDSLETFSTQEVTHKYAQPGSYTVTLCAYSSDGCSNCISYENITVVEDYAIYIPNVFTPNGDGTNDVFQYHLIGVKKVFIYVFNRWGEKVFETDNPNEYWDGTYKGKLLNPDMFVYQIKLVSYDNKQAEFKGSVSILK